MLFNLTTLLRQKAKMMRMLFSILKELKAFYTQGAPNLECAERKKYIDEKKTKGGLLKVNPNPKVESNI